VVQTIDSMFPVWLF